MLEVSGSITDNRPRHTKDVIKMEPVVHLFSTDSIIKETLALSQTKNNTNTTTFEGLIDIHVHIWKIDLMSNELPH